MRVVVVGAGLSGLTCAGRLAAAGHRVVVLERGQGPGGRMATRRIGAATFDHGAQFFTARSPEMLAIVQQWVAAGVAREWCRGFDDPPDGYPRYLATGGMNALAKHLARGLEVRTGALVFALRRGRRAPWHVVLDTADVLAADAVVLTTPVPQAMAIAITAEVDLPDALREIDYHRTIAAMAVLDGASAIGGAGAAQERDPVFSMIVDNNRKGVSAVPAVTAHVSHELSRAWWDRDRDELHEHLRSELGRWLGSARIVASELKRWRFAGPRTTWPESCWVACDVPGPFVMAGDAFAGPKIEGALRSGWAAADAVDARLPARPQEAR